MSRPLYDIAREVKADIAAGNWNAPGRGHAQPYLEAMATLSHVGDRYGCDSGSSVVAYFLANAGTWRGAEARRIKAELNAILKVHYGA